MMLYNALLELEQRKAYMPFVRLGVFNGAITSGFEIYKSYLKEIESEPRRTQAAYNVSIKHKCHIDTVYAALKTMRQPVDVCF